MAFYQTALRSSFALVIAAGLLVGCKKDVPTPPVVVAPAPIPTSPTPPQYGTPFTGVPDREDAVMYQVNIRAFSPTGNFAGVTARLDSIKALGVNVLYLMPIYPIGAVRSVNSPYAIRDYRAVNPEFGTLTDLRTLVDAAHARGLSVMLDWVANHTSWDHAWITDHPDWYQKNAAGTIISPSNNGITYADVAQLDFTNRFMRAEMISAMKSWIFAANVDGFRCDYADFQPNDFWYQTLDTMRRVNTHELLMLAEGTRAANYSSGFDYNFGFGFYGAIYQVFVNGQGAAAFTSLNNSEYSGASNGQHVVRYITNHDVNSSDGTPVSLFGGQGGAMSAFVVASLFKGVPMIYNGQEAGMTRAIPFPFTTVKVNWTAHPDVTRAYKQLLTARANSVALRRGTPTAYSSYDVCAFTKTSSTDQAFVIANVRGTNINYNVPAALINSTWTDALNGGTVTLTNQMVLPPYAYMVLKK